MRLIAVLVLAWALDGSHAAAQSNGSDDPLLTCTAFAASTGGPRTAPVATVVDIVVNRWSPDADRGRLLDALKRGQGAMLDTLQDMPRVGHLRTPASLGWDLHYASVAKDEEGGRRVVIATDRPISVWEAANRPRSIDYPFTFIELRLNREGQGEGKLSPATQVTATSDGRFVQLENYDAQPVQLNEVKCR
jgi:hypothetical protein